MIHNNNKNICCKKYPRKITPCPVDEHAPYNPQEDIPESFMLSLVSKNCLMQKG